MLEDRRKEDIEYLVRLESKVEKLEEILGTVVKKMSDEHDLHHDYIKRVLEREDRKAKLHQAIIEKTLSSLVWSTLVGIALLVWNSLKDHWKP